MSANSTSYSSVVLHNICEEISQTKTQNESTQNKPRSKLAGLAFGNTISWPFKQWLSFLHPHMWMWWPTPRQPLPASSISQIPNSLSFQGKKEEWCPLIIWSGLWDGFRRMEGRWRRQEEGTRWRLLQKKWKPLPEANKKKEEKNCEMKGGFWLD